MPMHMKLIKQNGDTPTLRKMAKTGTMSYNRVDTELRETF